MAAAVTTLMAKKKMLLARAGAAALPPIQKMAFGNGGVDADGTVIEPENLKKRTLSERHYKV